MNVIPMNITTIRCLYLFVDSLYLVFEVYILDQMPFKIYQEIIEHLSYIRYFSAEKGESISTETKAC